jgi:flagellar protein FlgJ
VNTIDQVGNHATVPNESVRETELANAARQFEALFTQQLLGAMRKTVPQSSLFPKGPGHTLYDHMMDTEVASHMASGQGTGIAAFLYQDWTGKQMPNLKDSTSETSALLTNRIDAPIVALEQQAVDTLSDQPKADHRTEHFNKPAPWVNKDPGSGSLERIDNGRELLRNLLPPTGLEKKEDYFLNQSQKRHDHSSGGVSSTLGIETPPRGSNDGHKENHDRTSGYQATGAGRVGTAELSAGTRRRISQQYRSFLVAEQPGSGHRRDDELDRTGAS